MDSDDGYIIYNYRPRRYDISSSEYIKKGNRIDITRTHGLGSGIYGVTTSDERADETITPIRLINPIVIKSNEMDSNLTTISIWLIDMVEQPIKLGKLQASLRGAEKNGDIDLVTSIQQKIDLEKRRYEMVKSQIGDIIAITNQLLGNTFIDSDIRCKLFGAINGFVKDYSQAKNGDFLLQPINYLLMSYNYDGIYNASTTGNTFARGSVAFMNINMRDQKQAFASDPYLGEENSLFYRGSMLDQCPNAFVSTTPRTRQRQSALVINKDNRIDVRAMSRSKSRVRTGSRGKTRVKDVSITGSRSRSRSRDKSTSKGGSKRTKRMRRYKSKCKSKCKR